MRGEVVQVDIKKRLVRIRMEDAAHVVALAFDQEMRISAATLNGGEVGDAFRGRHVVVSKGRVVIEGDESLSMTVDSMLSISGLKLPKITPDKEDPDGEFLERLRLVELAVGALHEAFGAWCARMKKAA